MILSKAENSSGVMVALYPSADVAQAIAQPGGEPVEELHLTLAYLGKVLDLQDPERLIPVLAGVAATMSPLTGTIAGIGHFTAGPEPVTYASPDVPGLPELRHRLTEAVAAAGLPASAEHGFTPHITLAYADIEPQIPNLALAFNELALVIAGERHTFPFTGKQAADRSIMKLRKPFARNNKLDALDKADYSTQKRIELAREGKAIPIKEDGKIVGGRYPIDNTGDLEDAISAFGRASDKTEAKAHITNRARALGATDKLPDDWKASKVDSEFVVPLWKDEDTAKQIVYGIVMQPGVPDSQGDVVSAEEIEQAAHRYLAESRLQDVQHSEEPADIVPIESFIAPCDMEWHGRPVLKGSWAMASHIRDPEVWAKVERQEITGYSIGGTAERADG